jgi:hypothetical protein
MTYFYFKPIREWITYIRRRMGSLRPSICLNIGSARGLRNACMHFADASGEIILRLEPALPSSSSSYDPPKFPSLKIKQLTEPMLKQRSSSLQERYKP